MTLWLPRLAPPGQLEERLKLSEGHLTQPRLKLRVAGCSEVGLLVRNERT
jgi:hypothetical protein